MALFPPRPAGARGPHLHKRPSEWHTSVPFSPNPTPMPYVRDLKNECTHMQAAGDGVGYQSSDLSEHSLAPKRLPPQVLIYIHIYTYVCICSYLYLYIYNTCVHMYIYIYMYMYMYDHIYIYVYVCMYIYINKYIDTFIYVYI